MILGAKGMRGVALCSELSPYNPMCLGREELDITSKEAVHRKITALKPEIIINCAAYTDVDAAEGNEYECWSINAAALEHICAAAKSVGAVLIQISTDYVFPGEKKTGYHEGDETHPLNVYGRSKECSEKTVMQSGGGYYIVRTSWLYGMNGKNFVDTILRIANEKPYLEVVCDQFGCPTYSRDLSKQIRHIIENRPPYGIYHATNSGHCSWFAFAREILRQAGIQKEVLRVTSKRFKRAAKRPCYSILLNTKLPKLRHWKQALAEYLKECGYNG